MQTQHIALALFLVLLAIGAIIIISILIIVKRRIARRKGRVGRTTYTAPGQGLPKVWKSNIEKKINATIKVRTEPQVFGPHYAENYDVYTASEQAILSVDPTLEAPPLRDTRDFLLKSRHHVMNPPPSRDYIEEYCRLYLWARHDLNPFGESEYTRLCELQSSLLETINHTGSLQHPLYSPTTSTSIGGGGGVGGQLISEPIVKVHKRTHSNFKINFPSFFFKATEHSQPRVVNPSVLTSTSTTLPPTTTTTTTARGGGNMSSPLSKSRTTKRMTSIQQSRPTRIKVLSKTTRQTGGGEGSSSSSSSSSSSGSTVASPGISLKRLSHSTHRKKHELLVSPSENEKSSLTSSVQLISHPSTHVFTNDIISEHDSNADNLSLTISKGDISTTSLSNRRRHSCQSDGSQTALIDLEPVIASNPKSSISSTRPIMKHTDTYVQSIESKSSIRYNKGMENEGVNC